MDANGWGFPEFKEFFDSIKQEQDRAIQVASDEREKAAHALREQLTERIDTGDANLREHIAAQINTLRQMVESAETLSETRHSAAQTAITKFENSLGERLKGMNEFRDQLREQSTSFSTHAESTAIAIEFRRNFETNQNRIAALERDQAARAGLTASVSTNAERIGRVESFQAKLMGAVAATGFVATMLGIISLVVTLSQK